MYFSACVYGFMWSGNQTKNQNKSESQKISFTAICKLQCKTLNKQNLNYWNNSVTSWNRILEKLTVPQLVKKFHGFYETWRFITVSTKASHWPISWARSIQSTLSHPTSKRSNLMFPSTSRSSAWPLPFRFSNHNFVCSSHLSHACYMPCISILTLITLIMLVKCTSYEAPHYAVFSSLPPLPPS